MDELTQKSLQKVVKSDEASVSIIRNRGFLNLWVNQILVQLTYNSLNFALIVWVYQLTHSNIAVSALLFSVYLPSVLFGLFSGVLVDVLDRRKIILAINFLYMVLFFGLIPFKENFWLILIITFLINTLTQFYTPTESSTIPLITKKTQLLIANSLFSTTLYISFLLGFGLSGALINFFGIDFIFAGGGILLAIAFLLALKFPRIVNKTDKAGHQLLKAINKRDLATCLQFAKLEISQTMRQVRGNLPVLVSICILASVQAAIGVMAVIVPSFLERVISIKATDASYVMVIPLGIGMVLGAFLIGKMGHKLPKRRIVGSSILLSGLLFLLVGVAPLISPVIKYLNVTHPLPFFYQPPLSTILAIGSALLGVMIVGIIVPSQTVLHENTPEQVRGKVFAVLGVAMAGFSIIPVIFTGVIADIFGTMPIFIGMGGTIALFGLLALKPSFFFKEKTLPFRLKSFLGLGHWKNGGSI